MLCICVFTMVCQTFFSFQNEYKTILFYAVVLQFSVIVTIISRSHYDKIQESRTIKYRGVSFNSNFTLCYIFLYRL